MKKAVAPPKPSDCFFCDYARAPRKDRENLVLVRGKSCFVVMNRYPYTGGHLLVAPLVHQGELRKLGPAAREEIFDLLVRMEGLLRRSLRAHGFNIGINLDRAAGAGVPGHLHFHVVPRWIGDANFMTTTGRVRVIPEALEELHARLQKSLRNGR
jgi:ATP adenylyltransferase